jgi:hypothetical protein
MPLTGVFISAVESANNAENMLYTLGGMSEKELPNAHAPRAVNQTERALAHGKKCTHKKVCGYENACGIFEWLGGP